MSDKMNQAATKLAGIELQTALDIWQATEKDLGIMRHILSVAAPKHLSQFDKAVCAPKTTDLDARRWASTAATALTGAAFALGEANATGHLVHSFFSAERPAPAHSAITPETTLEGYLTTVITPVIDAYHETRVRLLKDGPNLL